MNRPKITVDRVEDVRELIAAMSDHIERLCNAADHMRNLGLNEASKSRTTVRKDVERSSLLVLGLLDEFSRLHAVQCHHQETCKIDDAATQEVESEIIQILRGLKNEQALVDTGVVVPIPESEEIQLISSLLSEKISTDLETGYYL